MTGALPTALIKLAISNIFATFIPLFASADALLSSAFLFAFAMSFCIFSKAFALFSSSFLYNIPNSSVSIHMYIYTYIYIDYNHISLISSELKEISVLLKPPSSLSLSLSSIQYMPNQIYFEKYLRTKISEQEIHGNHE